jgi:Secretion system C-terminal sorting domain
MKKLIFIATLVFISLFTFGQNDYTALDAAGVTYDVINIGDAYLITFDEPITFYIVDDSWGNDYTFAYIGTEGNISIEKSNATLDYNNIYTDVPSDVIWVKGQYKLSTFTNVIKSSTTFFTAVDTTTAFNNGVASVPACVQDFTEVDIDQSFDDGVASVPDCVQDYTQVDIDQSFDDGVASVICSTQTKINTTTISVNVYPNPTTDYVNVSMVDYDYTEVYDIAGSLVKTETSTVVDFTELKTGTYFLKVYDWNGFVNNVKIVKN